MQIKFLLMELFGPTIPVNDTCVTLCDKGEAGLHGQCQLFLEPDVWPYLVISQVLPSDSTFQSMTDMQVGQRGFQVHDGKEDAPPK